MKRTRRSTHGKGRFTGKKVQKSVEKQNLPRKKRVNILLTTSPILTVGRVSRRIIQAHRQASVPSSSSTPVLGRLRPHRRVLGDPVSIGKRLRLHT